MMITKDVDKMNVMDCIFANGSIV